MQIYHYLKDNKKICYFGVQDNYVFFKKTEHTTKYKTFILKNIRKVFKELLDKNEYLYTCSPNIEKLNKWHKFVGMKLQETFTFKNKQWNIWIA